MSKYRNVEVVIDGIKFQSTKEGNRYLELKSLLKSGAIKKFERQVVYKLTVKGYLISSYKADFVVWHNDGKVEVEDVKSEGTKRIATFVIKKKLMKAIHGIEIKIM